MKDGSMWTKLQWGRIVAGAFLVEVALIIVFVPLLLSFDVATITPFLDVGVFVFGFVITWWLAKKVRAHPLLHGVLIGLLATALYVAMCAVQPGGIASIVAMYGPVQFFIGNALRIAGCAAGGFAAHLRTS